MKTKNDFAILLVDKRWLATWYGKISHDIPCIISYHLQLLLMFYQVVSIWKLQDLFHQSTSAWTTKARRCTCWGWAQVIQTKNSTDFQKAQKAESHESWILRFTFSLQTIFVSCIHRQQKGDFVTWGVVPFFPCGHFLGEAVGDKRLKS